MLIAELSLCCCFFSFFGAWAWWMDEMSKIRVLTSLNCTHMCCPSTKSNKPFLYYYSIDNSDNSHHPVLWTEKKRLFHLSADCWAYQTGNTKHRQQHISKTFSFHFHILTVAIYFKWFAYIHTNFLLFFSFFVKNFRSLISKWTISGNVSKKYNSGRKSECHNIV